MAENLPPRGEPTGGFKDYPDCTPIMSMTCGRPDCRRCHEHGQHGWKWATENALILARFFQDISKQLHVDRPLPPAIMRLMSHFDPNLNAHATLWNQERINREAKEQAKKFWNFKED